MTGTNPPPSHASAWLDDLAIATKGQTLGLIAHQASVDTAGRHTADALRPARIFGPEHGFFGRGAAGEKLPDGRHPWLGVPVTSLYGDNRRPTPEQFAGLDALVFDLQDLGFRCYTFVSTLRHVIEVAAEVGLPVHVVDRPIPLPGIVDGPGLDPACESFVGMIDAPMVYGLSPGPAARWIATRYVPDLDLRVWGENAMPWPPAIPPSPAIRTTQSAWSYLATVFSEAIPGCDVDRFGLQPFQVLSAAWFDRDAALALTLPGASLHPYQNADGHPGVRIHVTDPTRWRPAEASVHLLAACPPDALWDGAREDFFDKLYGTATVRKSLQAGTSADDIIHSWREAHQRFEAEVAAVRASRSAPA